MADCLDTLIGIAADDCECFAGIDEDYTVSDSGFYLTDPLYGVPNLNAILASAQTCASGDGGVWDILNNSKQSAIRDLRSDLTAALTMFREPAGAWRGLAAKELRPQSATITAAGKNGVQVYSHRRLIDMAFVVTDVYVGSNLTGTVDVKFDTNNPDFTQADITCNTVAGTFEKNTLVTEVRLPLYSPAEERLFYNLYWEPGVGERPLAGRMWCNTCGGGAAWSKFVEIGGFNLVTIDSYTRYAASAGYGLLLGGYISCNRLDFICNLDELNGYEWKQLLGRTLLFRAAINALATMASSDNINRYTLLGAEQAGKRMNDLTDAYNKNIEYIAKSLPTGFSGCWGCNKSDFKTAKIRI